MSARISHHQFVMKSVKPRQHARRERKLRAETRVEVLELRQHEDRHDDHRHDRQEEHDDRIRQLALDLLAASRPRARGTRRAGRARRRAGRSARPRARPRCSSRGTPSGAARSRRRSSTRRAAAAACRRAPPASSSTRSPRRPPQASRGSARRRAGTSGLPREVHELFELDRTADVELGLVPRLLLLVVVRRSVRAGSAAATAAASWSCGHSNPSSTSTCLTTSSIVVTSRFDEAHRFALQRAQSLLRSRVHARRAAELPSTRHCRISSVIASTSYTPTRSK